MFRDFLDKCLKKDQADRWSVKQLLNHDFVKHCERQCASTNAPPDDSVEWDSSAKDSSGDLRVPVEEESKEQVEVDEIVLKVTEYCMKDAKELIAENGYTLDNIVSWIQNLPTMQKA